MSRLRTERRAAVAWIILEDAARRNALDLELASSLASSIERADGDAEVGALVLTGAPGAFCAGADIATLLRAADAAVDERRQRLETLYRPFLALARGRKPSLVAVDGAAVGAGLNLVLAADLAVATPASRFMAGFGRLGLHPGGGNTGLLTARAGRQTAAALLLFGESVDGARAAELGLVHACVSRVELEARAQALAEAAAAAPSDVLAETKQTLRQADRLGFAELLARETEAQTLSLGRPDTVARLRARLPRS